MKRTAKFAAVILSAALLTMSVPLSFGADAAEIGAIDGVSSITIKTTDDGATAYYDEDGNEVSLSELNREVGAGSTELPSKYDLRDYDRSTPVRNQGSNGYCWAFASTASIESSVLSQPSLAAKPGDNVSQTLHLSESATPYFFSTNITDESSVFYNDYSIDESKGSEGGSTLLYALGLSAGYGTYPESLCSYSTKKTAHYSEALRYYSSYALEDYSEYSANDIDGVKAAIIENGAVCVDYMTNDEYYTDDGSAYCLEEDASGSGHEVTIIGWDDDFSAENFNEIYQPENDGAWLCKNSWGEDSHDGGYFWMSYESSVVGFAGFTVQSNDEFDNRYQNSCSYSPNEYGDAYSFDKSANIFTAKSSEILKQVSIGAVGKYDCKISIYRLNDNYTSPEDGTLLTTVSGSEDLLGIHTVYITDEVYLQSGDVFSVVVENVGDDEAYLLTDDVNKNRTAKTAYYDYGSGWCDYCDLEITQGSSSTGAPYNIGYPMIKAFTKNTDNTAAFDKLSQAIESAEAVLASTPDEAEQSDIDALAAQIDECKALLSDGSCGTVEINNSIILLNRKSDYVEYAVIYINDLDDYYTLAENLKMGDWAPKKVILNTDLDFEGEDEITPLGNSDGLFTAEFDGGGHTVKNANITVDNEFDGEVGVYGFFGMLKGTQVSNITFENCTAQYALVCNSTENTALKNISVIGCTVGLDDSYTWRSSSIFGLEGFTLGEDSADSSMENCSISDCTIKSYGVAEFSDSTCMSYKNCRAENNTLLAYSDCTMFDNDAQSGKKHIIFTKANIDYEDYNDAYDNYKAVLQVQNGEISVVLCSGDESTVTAGDGIEIVSAQDGVYTCKMTNDECGYIYYNEVVPENEKYFACTLDFDTRTFAITKINNSFFDDGVQKLEIPSTIAGVEVTAVMSEIIPDDADCESVEELVIPDTVTTLKSNAFSGLDHITSLTIGSGIKEITSEKYGAGLGMLTELNLSEGLEVIGEDMFAASPIENLTLPDSLRVIGSNAFRGALVTKFTFGKNIESIGNQAIGYADEMIMWENYRYIQVPGVVINGYSGTAAEEYAKQNGFTFVDLSTQEADDEQVLFDNGVFMAGDVNLDGKVTVEDVTELQKYLADITELSDIQLVNCSVNTCESTLDIRNATAIQKYLANIYESLEPYYFSTAKG